MRQVGVTMLGINDDLGQLHITIDPNVSCYAFTNSMGPQDLIWEYFMFHTQDIMSAHYCDCDFYLIQRNDSDINIRMSHEAAAKAFIFSLSRASKKAFVTSITYHDRPVDDVREPE